MRPAAERARAVWAVVEAAREVAREPGLVGELAAVTGLSREGVELGLARHLELAPTEEDIARLVARAAEAEAVLVILSANVFVGALRAIALAVAAAPRVVVRASRRDPVLAIRLARRLVPSVELVTELAVEDVVAGEIHVYGRDETIADVRARARVPVRGHGAGMGIAWIESPDEAARLADDVVPFDQRGCLSPRLVFVRGDAAACAGALHEALGAAIPRGDLSAEERAEAERWRTTMAYAGEVLAGREHAIGIGPLVVPPPGRHVQLVPVASGAEATALLAPLRRFVTTLGTDRDASLAPPWARIARLGAMQRPPLDGPVDLRPT